MPGRHQFDYGPSEFDHQHRFVTSYVWQLPPVAGASKALRHISGGWQLSGIFAAQTGSPFSVLIPCAAINAEGNNCRPNRILSGVLPSDQRSISRWFDVSAFAIPSQAYGNAGRNILRGPGGANLDLSLSKSFRWEAPETRRLQIRFESFNALNHTNFGLPIHSLDSPAVGTITSAAPARVIQLGARVEF